MLARLAALSLALIVWPGCQDGKHGSSKDGLPANRPNFLLFSIDTLRADHLGCYGYERETSPVIDALARQSVLFSQAFAPTPWTLPSHASMLTGVHPYDLGIRDKSSAIPGGVPLVSELLAAAGYQTAAIVDSGKKGYVGGERGFSRGFEEYHHAPHREGLRFKYDMAVTADTAKRWLENRDHERPFFLFMHTKSVHALPPKTPCFDHRCFPYDKPEPYRFRFVSDERAQSTWSSPEMGFGQEYLWSLNRSFLDGSRNPSSFPASDVEALKGLYDNGIRYVDDHLGRVLETMNELDLMKDTVIIITSDHGEAFLEHNLLMHQELYRQVLHVPLIVKLPGVSRGRVVSSLSTLSDVVPTVLKLAGLESPAHVTGRATLPESGRTLEPRELFTYYLFPPMFGYKAFALHDADWKLVYHNFADPETFQGELYNIRQDPDELNPIADETERAATMLAALNRRAQQPAKLGSARIDERHEALQEVKTLGYIN